MDVGPAGWIKSDLNVETLLEVSVALDYRVEALTDCRYCIPLLSVLPLSMQ